MKKIHEDSISLLNPSNLHAQARLYSNANAFVGANDSRLNQPVSPRLAQPPDCSNQVKGVPVCRPGITTAAATAVYPSVSDSIRYVNNNAQPSPKTLADSPPSLQVSVPTFTPSSSTVSAKTAASDQPTMCNGTFSAPLHTATTVCDSVALNGSTTDTLPGVRMDLNKLDDTIDYVIAAAVSDEPHDDLFFLSCRPREPTHCPPTPRANTPSSGLICSPNSSPSSSPKHAGISTPISYKSTFKPSSRVGSATMSNFLSSRPFNHVAYSQMRSPTVQSGIGAPLMSVFPDTRNPAVSNHTNNNSGHFTSVRHPFNPQSRQMLLPPDTVNRFGEAEASNRHILSTSAVVGYSPSASPLKANSFHNRPMQVNTVSTNQSQGIAARVQTMGQPPGKLVMPGSVAKGQMLGLPLRHASANLANNHSRLQVSPGKIDNYLVGVNHQDGMHFSINDASLLQNDRVCFAQMPQPYPPTSKKRSLSNSSARSKRRKMSADEPQSPVIPKALTRPLDAYQEDAHSIKNIMDNLRTDIKSLVSAPSLTSFSDMLTKGLLVSPHITADFKAVENFLSTKGAKYNRGAFVIKVKRPPTEQGSFNADRYIQQNLSVSVPCQTVSCKQPSADRTGPPIYYPISESPQPVSLDNSIQTFLEVIRSPGEKLDDSSLDLSDYGTDAQSVTNLHDKLLCAFNKRPSGFNRDTTGRGTPPLSMYHLPNPRLVCQPVKLSCKQASPKQELSRSSLVNRPPGVQHATDSVDRVITSMPCSTSQSSPSRVGTKLEYLQSSDLAAPQLSNYNNHLELDVKPLIAMATPDAGRSVDRSVTVSRLTGGPSLVGAERRCLICEAVDTANKFMVKTAEELSKSTGISLRFDGPVNVVVCSEICFTNLSMALLRNRLTRPDGSQATSAEADSRPTTLVSELASSVPILVQHRPTRRRQNGSCVRRRGPVKYRKCNTHWRAFGSDQAGSPLKRPLMDTKPEVPHFPFAPVVSLADDTRLCVLCQLPDDAGVCGYLLSVGSDKWVHANCGLWCFDVFEAGNGALSDTEKSIKRALVTTCSKCNKYGAAVVCYNPRCTSVFHVPCANEASCSFTDRGMYCTQHHPKDGHPVVMASLTVNRRVYVEHDEFGLVSDIVKDRQSHSSIRVGGVAVDSIGQILPRQLESGNFHRRRHIYPVGFRSTRWFWSCRVPNRRSRYFCEIQQADELPVFKVVASDPDLDNIDFVDSSCDGVWQQILDRIKILRSASNLVGLFPQHLTGEQLYGLTEPHIVRAVESLPGVACLRDYVFSFGKLELIPNMPLAVNPTGCARSEPAVRASLTNRDLDGDVCHALNPSGRRALPGLRRARQPGQSDAAPVEVSAKKLATVQQLSQMRREVVSNVYLGRSRIQGLGLFAARVLEPQSWLIEYVGEMIRPEKSDRREQEYFSSNRGIYMFRLDDETIVDATIRGGMARYINHSCQPNCIADFISVGEQSHIIIMACRQIERGEELCYDYNFSDEPGDRIQCLCRSPNCRKWLT